VTTCSCCTGRFIDHTRRTQYDEYACLHRNRIQRLKSFILWFHTL